MDTPEHDANGTDGTIRGRRLSRALLYGSPWIAAAAVLVFVTADALYKPNTHFPVPLLNAAIYGGWGLGAVGSAVGAWRLTSGRKVRRVAFAGLAGVAAAIVTPIAFLLEAAAIRNLRHLIENLLGIDSLFG